MSDMVKMILRGESPWGEIVELFPDGSAKIRIDNRLLNEWPEEDRQKLWPGNPAITTSHGYKENDIVLCQLHPEYGKWVPVADMCEGRS
jgi:hypothetical protein